MATEPGEADYIHDHEEEGGPTKTFLEHLEDLRWILMKCAAVVAVGFLLCLFSAPTLVKVLTWPKDRAEQSNLGKNPTATFFFGTNRLAHFDLTPAQTNLFGTNLHSVFEFAPVSVGSNVILGLVPVTNSAASEQRWDKINLRNFGPAAAFMLAVQIAIYGGIALSSPFLFYFIGSFVFPALKMKERHYVYRGLFVGTFLFALGVSFCYFALLPVALKASVQYSEWLGFRSDEWRAEEYINFVCKFLLGMGLGFELPVVILVLVKIGILDYRKLAAFRRYMIVINLILGAVLTTPEVITQILMALPLQILYECTVWIAWYWERKEKQRRNAQP